MALEYILPNRDTGLRQPAADVVRFWNSRACSWATGNLVESWHTSLIERTVTGLTSSLSGRAKILELGSGANNLNYYPAGFDFSRVVAVDISPQMLKYLRFSNPMIATVDADARDPLPFQDGSFDLAVSFFLMRYLGNQETVVKELIRVANPGGRIAIFDYDDLLYGCETRAFNAQRLQNIARRAGCSAKAFRLDNKFLPNLDFLVITRQR